MDAGTLSKTAKVGPVGKGTLIGSALGGSTGALLGYMYPPKGRKATRDDRMRSAKITAIAYGLLGGLYGGHVGSAAKGFRGAAGAGPRKPYSGRAPSWMGKPATKQEAKKKFRDRAMKTHPDRGGSEEAMKVLNNEWQAFKQSRTFEKLAAVLAGLETVKHEAFLNELTKIASVEGLVLSQLLRRQTKKPVLEAVADMEARAKSRWDNLA